MILIIPGEKILWVLLEIQIRWQLRYSRVDEIDEYEPARASVKRYVLQSAFKVEIPGPAFQQIVYWRVVLPSEGRIVLARVDDFRERLECDNSQIHT
jgi:hypothetical protein